MSSLTNVSTSLFLTQQQDLAKFPIQFTLEDFHLVECINRRNSVVWIANYKYSSDTLVLKEIDTTNFQQHNWVNVQREFVIINVKHPNILQTYGYFFVPPKVYFVLEHAKGGNLFKALKHNGPFPEAMVRTVMTQLLNACLHLHSENIIHRDLKLDNILLTSPGNFSTVVVADFGVCFPKVGARVQPETVVGTLDYMAPEVLPNEEQRIYSEKVDVWALGIMCYEMLHGFPPFADPDIRQTCYNITNSGFHVSSKLSEDCLDFICTVLKKSADERPDVQALSQHPWIAKAKPAPTRSAQLAGTLETEKAHVHAMRADFLIQRCRCEILRRNCATVRLHTDCAITRQLVSTFLRMKQYEIIAKPTLPLTFSSPLKSDEVYIIDTTPHNIQAIRYQLRTARESNKAFPMTIALVTVIENRLPRLLADTFDFYLHKPVERSQMQVFPPVVHRQSNIPGTQTTSRGLQITEGTPGGHPPMVDATPGGDVLHVFVARAAHLQPTGGDFRRHANVWRKVAYVRVMPGPWCDGGTA
ncbi:hypothetical protein CYMTET_29495 [Cymbomonas tetramitiformis]|uniref:Protein kinase domain-containing protein n=1 Tax=Cymbomonas tetramitiformis TaxID=36881 RepID=A0AAE0KUV3_9CHLO|nr:hypothetical protein CYMTET_29495 [Cymbomonas tetramitiformis]